MNFKFLKGLPDDQAANFFQELLWKLADAFDDGDYDRLYKHVYEWQRRGYAGEGKWQYEQGPFSPLGKPVSETQLALLTSSGHFVAGDDPEPFGVENLSQEEAILRINDFIKSKPTLSAVPVDTPVDQLCVRHGGYDIRAAQADPNVALPIERLREMASEGVIGELAPNAYSFVGATSQMSLIQEAGPVWVDMLKEQQIQAALLIPLWPVCHVSVGHLARLIEEAGIPSVIIAVSAFRQRFQELQVARTVITPYIMGRPLGSPGDNDEQRNILLAALDLLENAKTGGTILDYASPQ